MTLAGGALNILVGNGFVPQLGDTFTIITAGAGVVGTFAEPDGPNRRIVNGVLYAVIYNRGPNGSVLLQVSTPKPVVDPSNDALAYVENDGARAVDGGLILTEFDSSDITGATVSITGNFQSGQELLAFTDTATISGSLNATGDILTLTGTDTIANYQAALRSVTYTNTSNIPITETRTVTFRATDVNADLSDPATRDITIVSVNDPPAGANKTVSTAEDTPFTFGTADFAFTDPTESPGNALLAVRITTPPAAGSLTNNNVALTVGQSVLATDITAGRLRFTPAADASGSPHASFTFQVQDNGGTANGGIDLDQTTRRSTPCPVGRARPATRRTSSPRRTATPSPSPTWTPAAAAFRCRSR